jgi:hypothetical protein
MTMVPEVVIDELLHARQFAAEISRVRLIEEVIHARMGFVRGAESALCLAFLVGDPLGLDRHDGEQPAFRITKRNPVARAHLVRHLRGDIQRHWNGPKGAVGEPHVLQHLVIVGFVQEPFQGRESAVQQKLEVAELPLREGPRWKIDRLTLGAVHLVKRQIEVFQNAPVRLDQFGHGSINPLPC